MKIVNCEIKFRCPKTWTSLQDEGDPSIRFCDACQQQVYLCRSPEDVHSHVIDRHCVAYFQINEEEDLEEDGGFVGELWEPEHRQRRSTWTSLWSKLCFWRRQV